MSDRTREAWGFLFSNLNVPRFRANYNEKPTMEIDLMPIKEGVWMSEKAEEVYAFIEDYMEQNSLPPSVRDIAKGCYLNISTVSRYLGILEAQGRLQRIPGKARGLKLMGTPQ
jgi:LexA DNA binding domain